MGEVKPFLTVSGLLQACWCSGKVLIPYVAVMKESAKRVNSHVCQLWEDGEKILEGDMAH